MNEMEARRAQDERLPRVLIVSDVLLYREGLAASLTRAGILSVVGIVHGHDARNEIGRKYPDAVLLDASIPDGLALAREIHVAMPMVKLVGFGIGKGDDEALACAEAGLSGFVGREGTVADLASAVVSAMKGELQCSARLAALLFQRVAILAKTQPTVAMVLTRREREIAALIADGLSNKEIAIDLRIGPATVKNHVHNILDKLRVKRRGAIGSILPRASTRHPGPAMNQSGHGDSLPVR